MRKLASLITIAIVCILISSTEMIAQGGSKTKTVRKLKLAVPTLPKPKIEDEIWKEFAADDAPVKIQFPKVPEVAVRNEAESFGAIRISYEATTIQTYINDNYYAVDVIKYPRDFLGKREDLAQDFGAWLKTFILRRTEIRSEKELNYGHYKMVEFIYRQVASEIILHRAVVIGDRLFQLIIHLPVPNSLTPEQAIEKNQERINKFFDSLQVAEEIGVEKNVGILINYQR